MGCEIRNIETTVFLALRRSSVRRKILNFLNKANNEDYSIKEISNNINTNYCNTSGAIKGVEGRYDVDWSLVKLGLVEQNQSSKKRATKYRLTEYGKKIIDEFNLVNK